MEERTKKRFAAVLIAVCLLCFAVASIAFAMPQQGNGAYAYTCGCGNFLCFDYNYDDDNDNGEHIVSCSSCGEYITNEACVDGDENGECDFCGHEMGEPGEEQGTLGGTCPVCEEGTLVYDHDKSDHWLVCDSCGVTCGGSESHDLELPCKCGYNDTEEGGELSTKFSDYNDGDACPKCKDGFLELFSDDVNEHWIMCTDCDFETTAEEHDGDPCSVCGYESEGGGEYSTDFADYCEDDDCPKCGDGWLCIDYDENGHWYKCDNPDCDFATDPADHEDDPCSVCDYEGEGGGGYSTDFGDYSDGDECPKCECENLNYGTDDEKHWFYCNDPDCGFITTTENHDWSKKDGKCAVCERICEHGSWTNGVCDICDYECKHPNDKKSYSANGGDDCNTHTVTCSICDTVLSNCENHDFNTTTYTCKSCGYECQHNEGYDEGYCVLECGYECPHEDWSEGVCEVCGYECTHDWSNKDGVCKICSMSCEDHDWSNQDGVCGTCGYACSHDSWTEGVCDTCGYECTNHDWSNKDGKCKTCGYECTHSSGENSYVSVDDSKHNEICSTCQKAIGSNSHSYMDGTCMDCNHECSHSGDKSYNDEGDVSHMAVCSLCNKDLGSENHDWDDNSVCTKCGHTCSHDMYMDGSCVYCGKSCPHSGTKSYTYHTDEKHTVKCVDCEGEWNEDHEWVNGECKQCKHVCSHNWNGGTCDICNMTCSHNGAKSYIVDSDESHNIICSICSEYIGAASHTYSPDTYTCTTCNHVCGHSWLEGVCAYCNKVCTHDWSNKDGVCKICSTACTHDWENGVCKTCGMERPADYTVTFDGEETTTWSPSEPTSIDSGKTIAFVCTSDLGTIRFYIDDALDKMIEKDTGKYYYSTTEKLKYIKQTGDAMLMGGSTIEFYTYHAVAYDLNGGSGTVPTDTETYSVGDTITLPSSDGLSYAGYTFVGWSTDSAETTGYTASYSIDNAPNAGAITFYAIWEMSVTNYLTFSSDEEFTITIGSKDRFEGKVWYSTDKNTWTEIAKGNSASAKLTGSTYNLYFAGKGNTCITGTNTTAINYPWILTATKGVSVSGNTMSLLDYAQPDSVTMGNGAFDSLFCDWTQLVSAENLTLPATTLSDYCYYSMFSRCSNLTTAPTILPALVLKYSCYSNMFLSCELLTTAPTISATTVADSCCCYMFSACKSLLVAPELLSMKMEPMCYMSMFSQCTALTRLPNLPATTLAQYCYDCMFYQCTYIKLTTTDQESGSWGVPSNATDSSYATRNMFEETGGDFTDNPVIGTTYYYEADTTDYLTFTSDVSFTVTATGTWETILQYSTDKMNWHTVTNGIAVNSSSGTSTALYFRGYNNTVITGGEYSWTLTPTTEGHKIASSGDIMTLLDFKGGVHIASYSEFRNSELSEDYYDDYAGYLTAMGVSYVEEYIFSDDINLLLQYDYDYDMYLSAMAVAGGGVTMGNYAFAYMFKGQTALSSLPTLSATKLTDGCYAHMFENCTGIKLCTTYQSKGSWNIPSGATGGNNPFSDMFKGTSGAFTGVPVAGTTYYYATSYTVVYDLNNGTGTAPTDLTEYEDGATSFTFASTKDITRAGYKILGWALANDATTALTSYTINKDDATDGVITFYAIWEDLKYEKDITITINTTLAKGTKASDISVSIDDSILTCGDITLIRVPSNGSVASEIDETGTSYLVVFFIHSTEGNYFAKGSQLQGTLYNYKGNVTVVSSQYNNAFVIPSEKGVFENTLYILAGTYDKLYLYVQIVFTVYDVVYDANTTDTVTDMPTDTTPYFIGNEATVSTATPKRAGYKFLGWNTNKDATEGQTFADGKITMENKDVTLYAIWEEYYTEGEVAPYRLVYNDADGKFYADYDTENYDFCNEITFADNTVYEAQDNDEDGKYETIVFNGFKFKSSYTCGFRGLLDLQYCSKQITIVLTKDTVNEICSTGTVRAQTFGIYCHYAHNLTITGEGTLNIGTDEYKVEEGISCVDLTIEDATVNIKTIGQGIVCGGTLKMDGSKLNIEGKSYSEINSNTVAELTNKAEATFIGTDDYAYAFYGKVGTGVVAKGASEVDGEVGYITNNPYGNWNYYKKVILKGYDIDKQATNADPTFTTNYDGTGTANYQWYQVEEKTVIADMSNIDYTSNTALSATNPIGVGNISTISESTVIPPDTGCDYIIIINTIYNGGTCVLTLTASTYDYIEVDGKEYDIIDNTVTATFSSDSFEIYSEGPYTLTGITITTDVYTALNGQTASTLDTSNLTVGGRYVCKVTFENAYFESDKLFVYEISFDGNGATSGSVGSVYQLDENEIALPSVGNLVRTGYKFLGWNTEKTASTAFNSYTVGSSNATLYAVWEQKKTLIVVETDTDNAYDTQYTYYGAVEFTYRVTVDSENYLDITDFSFKWYKPKGNNQFYWDQFYDLGYMPSEVGTHKGVMYRAEDDDYVYYEEDYFYLYIGYKLTYDANDENATGDVPVDSGCYGYYVNAKTTTLKSPSNLTLTGYTFYGWNTKTDGTGTTYNAGKSFVVTENTTLYAMWAPEITVQPNKDNDYTVTIADSTQGANTYQWYKGEREWVSISGRTDISALFGYISGDVITSEYVMGSYFLNVSYTGADTNVKVRFKCTETLEGITQENDYYVVTPEENGSLLSLTLAVTLTDTEIYTDVYKPLDGETSIKLGTSNENASYKCFVTSKTGGVIESNALTTKTITFDISGGTGTTPTTLYQLEGRSITLPTCDCTKVGYKFLGWNTEKTASTALNSYTVGSSDATLYAIWQEKTTVSIAETAQSYTYGDSNIAFVLSGNITTGFTVKYYNGTTEVTSPTDAGSYKVVISRSEDDTYKSYEKTIENGLVINKATAEITVDKTAIVKTYGEAVTVPTATTTFGTVSCDKVSTDLVNAGSYTITYTVTDTTNYNGATETVSVTINKAAVSEPVVGGTYKYTGTAQTVVLTGVESYMTTTDSLTKTEVGVYTITFTLDGNHEWADDADGIVSWEIKAVKKETATENTEEKPQVSVESEEGFSADISVTVEVTVETNVMEATENKELRVDYYDIKQEDIKLSEDEKIGVVYDVKLIQTIGDISKEISLTEAQVGSKIKVKMLIPDTVDVSKVTRILSVVDENTIQSIAFDASKIDENGYYEMEIDKLSEFAFVYQVEKEKPCINHWIVMALLILILIITVLAVIFICKGKKGIPTLLNVINIIMGFFIYLFVGTCYICDLLSLATIVLFAVGYFVELIVFSLRER